MHLAIFQGFYKHCLPITVIVGKLFGGKKKKKKAALVLCDPNHALVLSVCPLPGTRACEITVDVESVFFKATSSLISFLSLSALIAKRLSGFVQKTLFGRFYHFKVMLKSIFRIEMFHLETTQALQNKAITFTCAIFFLLSLHR